MKVNTINPSSIKYQTMSINWNNEVTFTRGQLNRAITFVRNNMTGFLPLCSSERNKMRIYAQANKIPFKTMLSLRRHCQIQKSIYTRYPPNLNDIITCRLSVLDVELRKKPAKTVVSELRKCLLSFNAPLVKVHSAIVDCVDEYKCQSLVFYLNEFFKKSTDEANLVTQEAKDYELTLQKYLTKLNIEYETEDQLKERGMKLTPDILLKAPITITVEGASHQVYWIDAKSFALAPEKYFMKKLNNQAAKYVNTYGPGAFVFRNGIDASIQFPDVVCLDGSHMHS